MIGVIQLYGKEVVDDWGRFFRSFLLFQLSNHTARLHTISLGCLLQTRKLALKWLKATCHISYDVGDLSTSGQLAEFQLNRDTPVDEL